jgi:hypothetical protein
MGARCKAHRSHGAALLHILPARHAHAAADGQQHRARALAAPHYEPPAPGRKGCVKRPGPRAAGLRDGRLALTPNATGCAGTILWEAASKTVSGSKMQSTAEAQSTADTEIHTHAYTRAQQCQQITSHRRQ